MVARIDINCDAGESFGRWQLGRDEELFPLVSSVNVACGFHAGDALTMQRSVRLAARHGCAVGAHPGFPDLQGFGRRELQASAEEVYAYVLYQLGALAGFTSAEGSKVRHVKAHGALYRQMTSSEPLARAVAAAVAAFDPDLPLLVLAGSEAVRWASSEGVRVVAEAFPDRAYLEDGSLAPRNLSGALVGDPEEAAARAVQMARGEPLTTIDGGSIVLQPESLCIHGDGETAVALARAVRRALEDAGIAIAPVAAG